MFIGKLPPVLLWGTIVYFANSTVAYGSVESTLMSLQTALIGKILPAIGILGLVFAGLSFAAGSPNAKNHAMLAVFGLIIGFAAPSIIAFIRTVVQ